MTRTREHHLRDKSDHHGDDHSGYQGSQDDSVSKFCHHGTEELETRADEDRQERPDQAEHDRIGDVRKRQRGPMGVGRYRAKTGKCSRVSTADGACQQILRTRAEFFAPNLELGLNTAVNTGLPTMPLNAEASGHRQSKASIRDVQFFVGTAVGDSG